MHTLSKNFPRLTKEQEDAYLEDKTFALLNGYSEWEKSIPSYTLFQALEIFPEAKPIVKRELREELREVKKRMADIETFYTEQKEKIQNTEKSYHSAIMIIETITEYCERERADLIDKEKRIRFNLARLDGKVPRGEIGAEEITRAKEYPISELIEFRYGMAKCLWHNEKTASMHYYKKENRVHCFSCNKGWDSVDVVMRQSGISFVEAVLRLNKK